MNSKKFLAGGFLCATIVCAAGAIFWYQTNTQNVNEKNTVQTIPQKGEIAPQIADNPATKVTSQEPINSPKVNMYDSEEFRTLPLSAIPQLASISTNARKIIEKFLQNANVYYVNLLNDRIIVIKDTSGEEERFTRHDFEVLSVSLDGTQIKKEIEFSQKMSDEESEKEIWEYKVLDGDIVVPAVHKSLNENGKVNYIEHWYYNQDDPVKYKVTNVDGRVISIRKSSKRNDGNWSDEHIFYDEDGNTALNISIAYENNDIARFTYYNPQKTETSVTILNQYTDGEKTKETVYTADYQLKNIYTADYTNGKRVNIKMFDSNDNQLSEFLAK